MRLSQLVARHSGLAPAFVLSVDASRRVAYRGTTIGISASTRSIVALQPVPGVDPIVANNLTVHVSIGLASGTSGVALGLRTQDAHGMNSDGDA